MEGICFVSLLNVGHMFCDIAKWRTPERCRDVQMVTSVNERHELLIDIENMNIMIEPL